MAEEAILYYRRGAFFLGRRDLRAFWLNSQLSAAFKIWDMGKKVVLLFD